MKFFLNFLLAILAATALAAPLERTQKPLGGKHEHAVSKMDPSPQSTDFKRPFVVKIHPPPSVKGSDPKMAAAASVKGPAAVKQHLPRPGHGAPTWLEKWRVQIDQAKGHGKKEPAPSCFCAGGSICCHTLDGLNCNVGFCGI